MELKLNTDFSELGPAPLKICSGDYKSVVINLEDWSYALSKEIVRIKSIIQLARENNLSVDIKYPSRENVKHYVGRMGLFQGFSYEYPYGRLSPNTFFPIYEITNDQTQFLFDEFHRVLSFSEVPINYINEMADVFTELSDNVYFHSGPTENSGKGFTHAQVHLPPQNINMAIDDCGVSFLGSYKRTGQVRARSELQIIEDAFEEMESSLNSKPKNGHRGIGLFSVKNFIKKYGGEITVISGSSSFCIKKDDIIKEKLSYQYKGTNIELEVPNIKHERN